MKNRNIRLILGPLILLGCVWLLPHNIFTTYYSRAAIGTILWMSFWWVTGTVDYAVTAFLPIAINAIIEMTEMSAVIANYASETILLLLGGSILVVSWEQTGLDKRIAAKFLSVSGSNCRVQLIFWYIMSLFLSAFLPNAVVCASVTPLAVTMLKFVGIDDISKSKMGSKLLLYIAYATGIGGLCSPLGGAMNLVTVKYLEEIGGKEYLYTGWVVRFLPFVAVLTIFTILFMIRDVGREETLGNTKHFYIDEYKKFGRISKEELLSLLLFIVAVVLSFTRELYQKLLPGMKPAYIFIICAILSFLITDKQNRRIMMWKNVQREIVWELMFVFAGGMAAGTLLNGSGAVNDIGNLVSKSGVDVGLGMVFIIITFTLLLSDVTSNTATAAVSIPIIISIMKGLDTNPIPYIYIASIGVNLSFMLPTSIRAIPVGYGLKPKYMLKEGWKISVVIIILMTIMSYLFLKYSTMFSSI